MKTLIITITTLFLALGAIAQSSIGIYAGAQHCVVHQKKILETQGLIHLNPSPNFGYQLGLSYTYSLNDYLKLSNQTGYSRINLLSPWDKEHLSANYIKSVFLAGVMPFNRLETFFNKASVETGLGIAYYLKGSRDLFAHHDMSNIEISFDLGIGIPLKRVQVKPFMNIALTPYSRLDEVIMKSNFSFRTYGIMLNYQIHK